ncbi:unnamed protein product [Miscanthus lutarioriparius]|uniref:NAC domain-containing protein n=1 Tax=Miscanthus lutarioriparius TaxID=422564 RepID=A0A811NVC0_9POAL|nr:unnamed protein product [Miscanthus lutarioriparius]
MVATRSKTTPGPLPRSRPRPDLAAHPSEEELITSFLRPRVVSGDDRDRPCSASFIHDADVYSAGPGELTARLAPEVASNGDSAWYFFSAVRAKTRDGQRKARTVDSGDGCWHSEAGAKPVVEEGHGGRILVGHRQGFSFLTKVDGRRVRRHRGRPTEAEAGTPTPNGEEKKDSTQSRRGLADEDSTVTDAPDALWTDDSFFSWWMRNKDWLMEEYSIVDRPDEEIQKTYGLDEYLRLLKHHYVDFGCGHSPVLNS